MTVAKRPSGTSPLRYRGVESATPVQFVIEDHNPGENDYDNWHVGAEWLNEETQGIWRLVKKESVRTVPGSATRYKIATWVQAFGGSSSDVQTITGDVGGPVGPDIANNIDLVSSFASLSFEGDAVLNELVLESDGSIAVSFPTDSMTATGAGNVINIVGGDNITTTSAGDEVVIDIDGDVALSYTTDAGSAVAAMNVLQIVGASGLTTVASGNTVTISLSGSVATSYATDTGTATPNGSGQLTIAGGLNIDTVGGSNIVTVKTPTLAEGVVYATGAGVFTSLGKGTNGQLLIGATGSTPDWANITSGDASVTITNTANGINLESAASSTTSCAFSAYVGFRDLYSADTLYYWVADTELFDLGGDYDHTTGIFTAPSDGYYLFSVALKYNYTTGGAVTLFYQGFENATSSQRYDCSYYDIGATQSAGVVIGEGCVLIELSSGDTVRPYMFTDNVAGANNWIDSRSNFGGYKIL